MASILLQPKTVFIDAINPILVNTVAPETYVLLARRMKVTGTTRVTVQQTGFIAIKN